MKITYFKILSKAILVVLLVGCSDNTPENSEAAEAEPQVTPFLSPKLNTSKSLCFTDTFSILKKSTHTYTVLDWVTKKDSNRKPIYLIGENHYWTDEDDDVFNANYKTAYDSFEQLAKHSKNILATEPGEIDDSGRTYAFRLEPPKNLPSSFNSIGMNYYFFSLNPTYFLTKYSTNSEIEEAKNYFYDQIFE